MCRVQPGRDLVYWSSETKKQTHAPLSPRESIGVATQLLAN